MEHPVSIHIADVGARRGFSLLARHPDRRRIPGLRHGDVGLAAPLTPSVRPSPALGRVAFVGFWEDEAALEMFEREHPMGVTLRSGWRAALEPVRVFGSWPGIADDVNQSRRAAFEGPAVVITLGRLRLRRTIPFLRASAKAQEAVLRAPGSIWATGFARPPLMATCSLWESVAALSEYAYGEEGAGHPSAIAANARRDFHRQSAFVRFRPIRVEGSLSGRNPLAAGALISAP